VVFVDWEHNEETETTRAELRVWIRQKVRKKGCCGCCGERCAWEDYGGGERTWRHVDVGFATSTLVALARRVKCPTHGVTVAQVPWARHDSSFTRAFEDLIVYAAIASSKATAARRHSASWRAVNNACIRVATEALGRIDLLAGLSAIAIDEVKYKKGQKYLTVVCSHTTGKVVWAAKGRSDTLMAFFAALGQERCAALEFVTCDGAEWIHTVVAEQAPGATVCLDTFHVIKWATDAFDETRRAEWNTLRRGGSAAAAKEIKGLRWLLLRNWENLSRLNPRSCGPLSAPTPASTGPGASKKSYGTSSRRASSPPAGPSTPGWPLLRDQSSSTSSSWPAPSASSETRSKRP
jgi:transposase